MSNGTYTSKEFQFKKFVKETLCTFTDKQVSWPLALLNPLLISLVIPNGHDHRWFNQSGHLKDTMKTFTILIAIAILVANVQALGFDFKKISRLIATVDPKTCNCIQEQLCRIEIPYDYTSVLDISCQNSLKVPTKNMYNWKKIVADFWFKKWEFSPKNTDRGIFR